MTEFDLDPDTIASDIAAQGYAVRSVLDAATCREIASLWDEETRFRKRIVMQERAYGRGEYRYLAYPLPDRIAAVYPPGPPPSTATSTSIPGRS